MRSKLHKNKPESELKQSSSTYRYLHSWSYNTRHSDVMSHFSDCDISFNVRPILKCCINCLESATPINNFMQHFLFHCSPSPLPFFNFCLSFSEFRVCQKSFPFHIFLPVLLHWEGEVEQLISHPRGVCPGAAWPTTQKHKLLSAKKKYC